MHVWLILIAVAMLAGSGLPAVILRRGSVLGQRLSCAAAVIAALTGLTGVVTQWTDDGQSGIVQAAWTLPIGAFRIEVDALAAFFLVPVFLMAALGSIYGLGYWSAAERPESAGRVRFFYGLLAAGLAGVLIADDAVLFMMCWEIMALAGFFLITTEDEQAEVRQAGWTYLVATHLASLLLMLMFSLCWRATGSTALQPIDPSAGPGLRTAIFLLAVCGFGLKAGLMPLHVWLPGAHANAPSHVSAILSGVLIKMGVYGLVRMTSLLPVAPTSWGMLLLALGTVSGVVGVAFAIAQHDIKRLLAYHSIENIGIIVMGLGLAMIGRSRGQAEWVALGLAGCLLHVWNHSLFKSLLFFSAGSVVHATGTRQIDQLGGLARRMPLTSGLFLVGAVAICGLPPLNGLVSELMIYLGLFRTVGVQGHASFVAASLAAAGLALIGALAVACFVKAFGAVFLGEPRTNAGDQAHEAPGGMIWPMVALAACCLVIGVFPASVLGVLDQGVQTWAGPTFKPVALATLVPAWWVTGLNLALLGFLAAGMWWLLGRLRAGSYRAVGTWDCGYAAPTARMQYTASSLAGILVGLLGRVLRPAVHRPRLDGLFPRSADFESHTPEVVLDRLVAPALRRLERLVGRLRFLRAVRPQVYILYIFVAVVGLFLWLVPAREFAARMLGR